MVRLETLFELLGEMVGCPDPIGDEYADEVSYNSLMRLIDVTIWCLSGIAHTARYADRPEASMRKVGRQAYAAMVDWRDWLDEELEERK